MRIKEQTRKSDLWTHSPVCTRCRHLDHERHDAKRCRAFPSGIPVPIWKGENNHRTPYPGDNGVLFEAMTDADWRTHREQTNALWVRRERARARMQAAADGALSSDMLEHLPRIVVVRMGEEAFERPDPLGLGDVVEWWLNGARDRTYGRASVERIERTGDGGGADRLVHLAPGLPEFWESLEPDATIELCDRPVTVARATVVAVERYGEGDAAALATRSFNGATDRHDWTNVEAFEAELRIFQSSPEDHSFAIRSGDIVTWMTPAPDRPHPASAFVELLDANQLRPGDSGRVRLMPCAHYFWRLVDIGSTLPFRDVGYVGETHGEALVTRAIRAEVLAGQR